MWLHVGCHCIKKEEKSCQEHGTVDTNVSSTLRQQVSLILLTPSLPSVEDQLPGSRNCSIGFPNPASLLNYARSHIILKPECNMSGLGVGGHCLESTVYFCLVVVWCESRLRLVRATSLHSRVTDRSSHYRLTLQERNGNCNGEKQHRPLTPVIPVLVPDVKQHQ